MKVPHEHFWGWSWRIWKHSCFELNNSPERNLVRLNLWGFVIMAKISKTNLIPIHLLPALYFNCATIADKGNGLEGHTRGLGLQFLIFDISFNFYKNVPVP